MRHRQPNVFLGKVQSDLWAGSCMKKIHCFCFPFVGKQFDSFLTRHENNWRPILKHILSFHFQQYLRYFFCQNYSATQDQTGADLSSDQNVLQMTPRNGTKLFQTLLQVSRFILTSHFQHRLKILFCHNNFAREIQTGSNLLLAKIQHK